jgi:hypothetical protein
LKIAKSEIGSNRANRRNRFLTVTQYCLDIALVMRELQRVCKYNSRIIFVIGHESNVLGVPFSNTKIILEIARQSEMFKIINQQSRVFKNNQNVRQEYKTPETRKLYRQEYVEFIENSKYYSDVFQRMINKIQTLIDDTAPGVEQVLQRGHF